MLDLIPQLFPQSFSGNCLDLKGQTSLPWRKKGKHFLLKKTAPPPPPQQKKGYCIYHQFIPPPSASPNKNPRLLRQKPRLITFADARGSTTPIATAIGLSLHQKGGIEAIFDQTPIMAGHHTLERYQITLDSSYMGFL